MALRRPAQDLRSRAPMSQVRGSTALEGGAMLETLPFAVLLLLAAPPVSLPAPRPEAVPGCAAAACTGDPHLRVCKCVPASAEQRPGLLVDREGDRHWSVEAMALANTPHVARPRTRHARSPAPRPR